MIEMPPQIQVIGEEPQHQNRAHEREAILGFRSLYSFMAEIEYGYHLNLEYLDLLFRALATCPNLKELDLSTGYGGCEFSSATPEAFNFRSHPDVRFQLLGKLTVSGYRFDEWPDGGNAWDYVKESLWKERLRWPLSVLPNSFVDWVGAYNIEYVYGGVKRGSWPACKEFDGRSNLDAWLEVMDWSHLHTLNLKRPKDSTLAKLGGNAGEPASRLQLSS